MVYRQATKDEEDEITTGRLRAIPCRLLVGMKRKLNDKGGEIWVRKARIVVCGNMQPASGEELEPYALSTR